MATSSIPPDLVVDPRLHYPRSRVVTNRDERCPLLDDARIPQMPLGHEQPDVPPQLYARGLDSAGTSSSAIIGRCVFCARQEHSLLPVYNAAPHVPPVDNAAAERLKKLKKELKTCRPIGIAAIALVMSIGLFVASTSNILSKAVKFWSVGQLIIVFILTTLTTLAAYRVEPTNFNIDLISVGLTAVILYLVDVLLLLFFCLSPYDWGSNQKAISLAIGLGAALDSCIFLICVNIWKRPMVIYNSPFMAHLKKITCAVMTLLLKVLLAVLMVGVVFIMGCWEILKALGGSRRNSPQLGGVNSCRSIPQMVGLSSIPQMVGLSSRIILQMVGLSSIPQMVGLSSSRGSLSSPPWGIMALCNAWRQKKL
uniref:Uncharacterized protein n=1 Tax=Oryza rufipogon TaxID=4529 RepID=A0A0E0R5U9_ORYRU